MGCYEKDFQEFIKNNPECNVTFLEFVFEYMDDTDLYDEDYEIIKVYN